MIHGEMVVHLNGHSITTAILQFQTASARAWFRSLTGLKKWKEKKKMTPAEPLGDIHMPNSSILPLMIALGLFVAAFGAIV